MKQIELEHEIEMPDGKSVFFEVTVNLLSPGCAGYTSGPPEKCYPPEPPELEIDTIRLLPIGNYDGIEMPPPIWGLLGFTKEVCRRLENEALEKANREAEDDEMARADHEYDLRKDRDDRDYDAFDQRTP